MTLAWDCYDCVDWPTLRNMHHPATDCLLSDTTIVATADGVVVKMNTGCGGQGCGNSYGNWVFLEHRLTDGTTLYSVYRAHVRGRACSDGRRVHKDRSEGRCHRQHRSRQRRPPAFRRRTNTNLLDYTSALSATVGSINPDTLYGKVKVKSC